LDYDFNRAIEELKELEERAAPLLTLGAIASVPFSEFRETLRLAPASRQQDLLRILQPFLESTKARIDALAPIANVLTLLLDMLNGYLARKSVTFNVRNGFELSTPITHSLPLAALSSGEKHLFLLLCSAFLSRQRTCLFLVDEPELSLNVYWQRKLPRTLQQLIEGTPVQYILATHSLEILTEFNHRINQLSA
jgi:hypothetical protein